MHPESYEQARIFAESLPKDRALLIADVGSQDINGCYRPLFDRPGLSYVGIDQAPGKNVDHVMTGPNVLWGDGECFDVVVCGQVLEHAEMPWVLAKEIVRVLKPGGMAWLSAPHTWPYHAHPKDCWRIYPDGMRALLQWAGLIELRCFQSNNDTVAWTIKP